jgi:hypothetical protein
MNCEIRSGDRALTALAGAFPERLRGNVAALDGCMTDESCARGLSSCCGRYHYALGSVEALGSWQLAVGTDDYSYRFRMVDRKAAGCAGAGLSRSLVDPADIRNQSAHSSYPSVAVPS